MNFDFEKNFHPKKEIIIIPKEWLDELNKELPDNMEYHYDENNHVLIAEAIDGEGFKVEGLRFALTKEQESILGNKYSFDDILTLIDNTQEPVEIVPIRSDATVCINGKRVSFNKLVMNMPNGLLIEEPNKKVFAFRKVNQSIEFELSNSRYKQSMVLHRMPVKTIDYILLESSSDSILTISLKADLPFVHDNPVSITIGLKTKNATSISDLVEAISLYNSFVDPSRDDGRINGDEAHLGTVSERKVFDPYTELFWNKVLAIEKITSSSFSVPEGSIDNDTVKLIDELYYSLVKRIPIRKNYKFETLVGEWDEEEIHNLLNTYRDQALGVVFSEEETKDNLFGTSLSFIRTKAGYDIKINGYKVEDNLTHLIIEKNASSYVSELLFSDEAEFNSFQKEHNLLDYMKDAETISVILEKDDDLLSL